MIFVLPLLEVYCGLYNFFAFLAVGAFNGTLNALIVTLLVIQLGKDPPNSNLSYDHLYITCTSDLRNMRGCSVPIVTFGISFPSYLMRRDNAARVVNTCQELVGWTWARPSTSLLVFLCFGFFSRGVLKGSSFPLSSFPHCSLALLLCKSFLLPARAS